MIKHVLSFFFTINLFFSTLQANQNWEAPFLLGSNYQIFFFDQGLDASGNDIAVWVRPGDPAQFYYAIKPIGQPWTSPISFATEGNTLFDLSLAVDPNGNAIIVWTSALNRIFFSQYSFGGSWSTPALIDLFPNPLHAQVLVDDNGNAVAIWNASSGELYYSTMPFGGSWATPGLVTATGANTLISLTVAPNGNAMITWSSDETTIMTSTMDFGGTPSIPVSCPGYPLYAGAPQELHSACDSDGNLTVAWRDAQNPCSLWGAYLPYSGAYTNVATISDGSENVTYGFGLVVDSLNNSTLAWGSNQLIYAQGTLGTWPSTGIVQNEQAREVSMDINLVDNTIIASWYTGDGIFSAELPFGGSWTVPVIISNPNDNGPSNVVIDYANNATALWTPSFLNIYTNQTNVLAPVGLTITPDEGPIAGGTAVTITGLNLTETTAVSFGGTPAASFIVVNDTTTTAISPPHGTGPVNVTITTPEGTSTQLLTFTFLGSEAPLPPSSFTGIRGADKFLTQRDYYNQLFWTASPDPSAETYRLYRNGQLIAVISSTELYTYIDHNRSKHGSDTYLLTAVNRQGTESPPLALTLS